MNAVFYLALTLVAAGCASSADLRLTQILFRHGARTPINPFPKDAYRNDWPEGYGQLTNSGKQQHYELGTYLRQRYNGYLNSTYVYTDILINSTNVDRTLMSAYSDLSGLYPPVGNQVWNPDLPWQPIPVHMMPSPVDYVLDTDSYCPNYWPEYDAVLASPQMQAVDAENADLYDLLTQETGTTITNVFDLSDIYDTLFIEKQNNLTTPSWADPVYPQMQNLSNLQFGWRYVTPLEQRLKGGPMLGHMIDNMLKRINGVDTDRKAYIFSSHDTSVAAFLMTLDLFNYIAPPYACAVIVELLETTPGAFAVEISYRNDTSVEPYVLTIPNCSSPCPIDQFQALTNASIPTSIVQECGVQPSFFAEFPWTVALGVFSLMALLAMCAAAGYYCWRRQRTNKFRYVMVESE